MYFQKNLSSKCQDFYFLLYMVMTVLNSQNFSTGRNFIFIPMVRPPSFLNKQIFKEGRKKDKSCALHLQMHLIANYN